MIENDGDEIEFNFLQFHFHSPSEHTIDGEYYDAEVHFVHQNPKNPEDLMVRGVLLDTDSGRWKASKSFFEDFKFDKWGEDWEDEQNSDELKVNVKKFFNQMEDKTFYNYEGSLTNPPCSEGVRWFLMREVQYIDPDHLSYL